MYNNRTYKNSVHLLNIQRKKQLLNITFAQVYVNINFNKRKI
jgi:hypothetical protein